MASKGRDPTLDWRAGSRSAGSSGGTTPSAVSSGDRGRARLEDRLGHRLLEGLGDPDQAEAGDEAEDPHAREEAGDPEAELQGSGRGGADAEVRDQGETGRAPGLIARLRL